jgi:hypothetical protein
MATRKHKLVRFCVPVKLGRGRSKLRCFKTQARASAFARKQLLIAGRALERRARRKKGRRR